MKTNILRRIEAAENNCRAVKDNGPVQTVIIHEEITLEESEMLKEHYGEPERKPNEPFSVIEIHLITPIDRPARPIEELIEVWEKAKTEAYNAKK